MYGKGLVTVCACDLVLALVALPLALRKVQRNRAYGFRTPTTLSNDFLWYEANAHFGRGGAPPGSPQRHRQRPPAPRGRARTCRWRSSSR